MGIGLFILVVIGAIIKLMFTEYKSINQEYNNMKQQGKLIQMNVDPAEGIESESEMQEAQTPAPKNHHTKIGFL